MPGAASRAAMDEGLELSAARLSHSHLARPPGDRGCAFGHRWGMWAQCLAEGRRLHAKRTRNNATASVTRPSRIPLWSPTNPRVSAAAICGLGAKRTPSIVNKRGQWERDLHAGAGAALQLVKPRAPFFCHPNGTFRQRSAVAGCRRWRLLARSGVIGVVSPIIGRLAVMGWPRWLPLAHEGQCHANLSAVSAQRL